MNLLILLLLRMMEDVVVTTGAIRYTQPTVPEH